MNTKTLDIDAFMADIEKRKTKAVGKCEVDIAKATGFKEGFEDCLFQVKMGLDSGMFEEKEPHKPVMAKQKINKLFFVRLAKALGCKWISVDKDYTAEIWRAAASPIIVNGNYVDLVGGGKPVAVFYDIKNIEGLGIGALTDVEEEFNG